MDTQNSRSLPVLSEETFKSPLILNKISGFPLVLFALSVSTCVMFSPETPQTTSDPNFKCLLLSMAFLTFFLSLTLLPLFCTMNSTNTFEQMCPRLIDYLAISILISSFTTIILTISQLFKFPSDLTEFLHGNVGCPIELVLICFALVGLYELIREKFISGHHRCLNVAHFALGVGFTGLYTGPLYYLPGTSPYSSFIYQTDRLYQIALLPITFLLGTILLILGVVSAAGLRVPLGCVVRKEALTASTLAVGLITLLTGTFLIISFALDNLDMPGGFGDGGA